MVKQRPPSTPVPEQGPFGRLMPGAGAKKRRARPSFLSRTLRRLRKPDQDHVTCTDASFRKRDPVPVLSEVLRAFRTAFTGKVVFSSGKNRSFS
jgi:hypothetical protein